MVEIARSNSKEQPSNLHRVHLHSCSFEMTSFEICKNLQRILEDLYLLNLDVN